MLPQPAPQMTLLRLISLLLLACLGTGATCGGLASDDVSCFLDDDCLEAGLCVRGFCRAPCDGSGECEEGELCEQVQRPGEGDLVEVCLAPDAHENNGVEVCVSDEECREALSDPGAACSVDGVCYRPQGVWAVLVRDTTTIDMRNPTTDGGPGADIAAVFLADDADGVLAPGETLLYEPAGGVEGASVVDGSAPALSADGQCVEGELSTDTTPLGGEGGLLLVRFLDDSGDDVLGPPETWEVVVVEWGSKCPGGDDADSYEVFLCFAPSFESMGPGDCQRRLSEPMSGRGEFRPGEL